MWVENESAEISADNRLIEKVNHGIVVILQRLATVQWRLVQHQTQASDDTILLPVA